MHTMNKIFLDTNVLLYLYATDEFEKTNKVKELLQQHQNIFISTQVLFEFSNVMYKKYKIDCNEIKRILTEFRMAFDVVIITYDALYNALSIQSKYKYSFPDSLIISTALEYGCDILFSEDMHNNHTVETNLKVINPFA